MTATAHSTPNDKDHWREMTLGDVLSLVRNGVNVKQRKDGIGQPISRIETIAGASVDYSRVGFAELDEKQQEKFRLKKGDILFSHINSAIHVGKTALVREDSDLFHGVNLLLFRSSDSVHPQFLNLFLKKIFGEGYWRTVCKQSVNQASVNQTDVKRVTIPVPPLAEQERIVGILDEAFEGIATATAHAERNLINAQELFQSVLQSTFEQKGEGRHEPLHFLVERLTNGYVGPTRDIYKESGVPYLLARHVKSNVLKFDEKTFVTDDFNEKHKKSMLKTGDVLLVQSGHIGHSAVVPAEHMGHNCHAMIVITTIAAKVRGDFLSYYFDSPVMQKRFSEIRSGSTVPHLTCRAVKELLIPVPLLKTQAEIVAKLDALSEETKRLEAIYQRKLDALAELKQSLLQRAFAGEL